MNGAVMDLIQYNHLDDLLKNEPWLKENSLWLCDSRFKKDFARLKLKTYFVEAGEKLKDLNDFPQHIHNILEICPHISRSKFHIVAVGGGSVGDFASFCASVIKRGIGLVHIPTTWLALIDSSHGGKTALNVGPYKNQIGTFYPSKKIFAVMDLLQQQNENLFKEASSELLKVFLLKSKNDFDQFDFSGDKIWDFIKKAVTIKYQFVREDPYETKGIRTYLNLGHTWAHIAELKQNLSHGAAVLQGLYFCINWSFKKGLMSDFTYNKIFQKLNSLGFKRNTTTIPIKEAENILRQDKKRTTNDKVQFVFLKDLEDADIQEVSIEEFLNFAKADGWIK